MSGGHRVFLPGPVYGAVRARPPADPVPQPEQTQAAHRPAMALTVRPHQVGQ